MTLIKQFIKLTLFELRIFMREPIALFFTIIFPVIFLFLTMDVFIPAEVPNEAVINQILPSLMVLIIASAVIFNVPSSLVSSREIKFLKRLKGAPVSPLTILASLVLANLVATIAGAILLIVAAWLIYDASFTGNYALFIISFLFSFLSLASFFLFIPAVAKSGRTALAISQIVFFPMMFFSGVFMPVDQLPEWVAQYISPFIPLTYAVELLNGAWNSVQMSALLGEAAILLGMFIAGLAIAKYTFKWE